MRPSNDVAVEMYKKRDYIVYREVTQYYSKSGPGTTEEDAYDMRKALSGDPNKETLETKRKRIDPSELEFH